MDYCRLNLFELTVIAIIDIIIFIFILFNRFEKYIGGKYLGELCRIILRDLYKNDLLLLNLPESDFPEPWTFGSDNVSRIEQLVVK